MSGVCVQCGGPCKDYENYCSWDCSIACARAEGGVEHLPNGLPVRCIRADGTMLECDGGDHPDYLFPVEVENTVVGEHDEFVYHQLHAVIYTDGCIALTLYERCYALWHVRAGSPQGGKLQQKTERLTPASVAKLKEWREKDSA